MPTSCAIEIAKLQATRGERETTTHTQKLIN